MKALLRIFQTLLAFTGLYSPSLLQGVWMRKAGIGVAGLLTVLTVLLVIQDVNNLRRISSDTVKQSNNTGAGGPVIPFTLQLYHSIIHIAVLLLRLHIPPDIHPIRQKVFRMWTYSTIRCSSSMWVYLLACIFQLAYTTYISILMPTPFDFENDTFYTLDNWPFVIFKILDVVWAEMPILDIVALGALIFLGWVKGVVRRLSHTVARHKIGLYGGIEPMLSEIFRGELDHELKICRDLWSIWEEASPLLGLILLHCLWAWTALFCLVTFNAISSAVDLGPLDSVPLGFLFLFVCLATKLVVITNAAHKLHEEVAALERSLVEVRLEWGFNEIEANKSIVQLHVYCAHRPITVTARGHFGVGREMLASVWGVVSTYVVVLLQFWQTTRKP